jgi:hypothetical protein
MSNAQLDIAEFGELIDAYQCAQKDGSHDDRAKARIALMNAYRAALAASWQATVEQIEQRADEASCANGYGVEDGTGIAHSHWWTFDRDGLLKFARTLL